MARPFDTDLTARRGLAFQLVEGIALLSKVDWRARGLSDLGRPDGFHDRQVDRWTAFLDRIKDRQLPGFDEAAAWLRAHKPLDYRPGIMHGDYQFANVDLTGMPSWTELLGHYAAVSGRQVDDIDYYCVLARWKLAVVLAQTYQRSGDRAKAAAFSPIAAELMASAAELAATTRYDG